MNRVAMIFIIASLLLIGQYAWAGQTVSQTFRIGAYLPPHIITGSVSANPTMEAQPNQDNLEKTTTVEILWQDQQKIVLQTTVVK